MWVLGFKLQLSRAELYCHPISKQTCFQKTMVLTSNFFSPHVFPWWKYYLSTTACDSWGKNLLQRLQRLRSLATRNKMKPKKQNPETRESDSNRIQQFNLFPGLIHSFILEESSLLRAFICKTKDRIKMSPCTQMADLPFPKAFVEAQL